MLLVAMVPLMLAGGLRAEAPTGGTPQVDAQGEWYAVGYRMGMESIAGFRMLELTETDISQRLEGVLDALGAPPSTLKNSELKLLQRGWDDAAAGRAATLTYPPDQPKSLVPKALRGFHKFVRRADSQETLADKVVEWKKAVVKVLATSANGENLGHGSGFFIGPGLVVTNHHVAEGGEKLMVQLEADNTWHPATVVAQAEVPDVALLQIEKRDNETLPIGVSKNCRQLEEVVLIGYPKYAHLNATSVKGSISATNLIYRDHYEVLQLDIRANPGDSGGPVINSQGSVVGILTFGLGAVDAKLSQFTFAQESDFWLPFLQKYAPGKYELVE